MLRFVLKCFSSLQEFAETAIAWLQRPIFDVVVDAMIKPPPVLAIRKSIEDILGLEIPTFAVSDVSPIAESIKAWLPDWTILEFVIGGGVTFVLGYLILSWLVDILP